MIDTFNRQGLGIDVDFFLLGTRVVRSLGQIIEGQENAIKHARSSKKHGYAHLAPEHFEAVVSLNPLAQFSVVSLLTPYKEK